MRTIAVALFAALLVTGCASGSGIMFFDSAVSVQDYCDSAASYAETVFAAEYRDKMGLDEKGAQSAVRFEAKRMIYNASKTVAAPDEMENNLRIIRKEERAKLEAVKIAYKEPRLNPEKVRVEVNQSCTNGWGGDVWYSLRGLKL